MKKITEAEKLELESIVKRDIRNQAVEMTRAYMVHQYTHQLSIDEVTDIMDKFHSKLWELQKG